MARRKKNSAKVNMIIAAIFHALIIAVITFFAAREGVLGKKLKEIAVVIVPKEKPPEEAKPPVQHIEPPKAEDFPKPEAAPKPIAQAPKPAAAAAPKAPSGGGLPPVAAPAAVIPADFAFGDGARETSSGTNSPVDYYRSFVQYTLRANWNRPDNMNDDNYADIVEVTVNAYGDIKSFRLKKTCGNKLWDDSVREAVASTKSIGRQPPRGFPYTFDVQFDVLPASEPVAQ